MAATRVHTGIPSDFDAENMTKSMQEHGQTLDELTERIGQLEKKLTDSKEFADIFKRHVEESKTFDAALTCLITDGLKNNTELKDQFTKLIDTIDKNAIRKVLKGWLGKILFAVWTIAMIILTAWIRSWWGK